MIGLFKAFIRIPFVVWFLVAGGLAYMDYNDWNTNVYEALKGEVSAKENDIQTKTKAVAEAQKFIEQRDQKRKEIEDLYNKVAATKAQLPRSSSVPELLRALADISDQAGIEFREFTPLQPRKNRFLVETPITVQLKGTYLQVMSFLDASANMTRVVTCQKLSFSPTGKEGPISASASLVTFHLDESAGDTASSTSPPTSAVAPAPGGAPAPPPAGASGVPGQ